MLEGLATSPEELAARKQSEGQGATPQGEVAGEGNAPEPKPTTGTAATPSVDWLSEFNKTLGTQYKSADEIKPLMDLPNKVREYEEKAKVAEAFPEKEKSYLNKIKELESSLNPLTHFSSKEAYIAEQLRKQHPDKNQSLLHDVATKDLAKMDALEVLINGVMLDNPDVSKAEAQDWVNDKYGIDPETPAEEWSSAVKSKVKIAANEQRKELAKLKSSIELPEILTPEQVEQKKLESETTLRKQIKPLQDKFSQFDKFTEKVGDNTFEFVVPDEYRAELPTMFEAFFVNGGQEVNETNLATIAELRDSLMLKRNFADIYRAIETDVEARVKKTYDERLGNAAPPNSSTSTDQGEAAQRSDGIEAFLKTI